MRILAVLLLAAGLLVACGDDDTASEPEPTPTAGAPDDGGALGIDDEPDPGAGAGTVGITGDDDGEPTPTPRPEFADPNLTPGEQEYYCVSMEIQFEFEARRAQYTASDSADTLENLRTDELENLLNELLGKIPPDVVEAFVTVRDNTLTEPDAIDPDAHTEALDAIVEYTLPRCRFIQVPEFTLPETAPA